MNLYISGKITGEPCYKENFAYAEQKLKEYRHVVLNPASLPSGLDYSAYMDIDMAMIRACDGIVMIGDWENSPGACAEYYYAKCLKKTIYHLGDLI
jgi:hypothetical protein